MSDDENIKKDEIQKPEEEGSPDGKLDVKVVFKNLGESLVESEAPLHKLS